MRDDEIIVSPLMTEKSTLLRDKENKYSFIVSKDANKILVAGAVKRLFNVTPVSVNILNIKGKLKKVRAKYGFTSSYKKAVVTVKKGEKIGIFEGA
jgi:large subunit ribosomal protein L23